MSGWDRHTRNPITPAGPHRSPLSGDIPADSPTSKPLVPCTQRAKIPLNFSVLLLLQHYPATTSPTGATLVCELSVAIAVHYPAETYSQTFRNYVASVDAT